MFALLSEAAFDQTEKRPLLLRPSALALVLVVPIDAARVAALLRDWRPVYREVSCPPSRRDGRSMLSAEQPTFDALFARTGRTSLGPRVEGVRLRCARRNTLLAITVRKRRRTAADEAVARNCPW